MQLVRGRHIINPYHLYIYKILVIKRWNSCVLNSYDCSKFFKHTFNMFSMCFSIGVHPWHELVLLLAPLFSSSRIDGYTLVGGDWNHGILFSIIPGLVNIQKAMENGY